MPRRLPHPTLQVNIEGLRASAGGEGVGGGVGEDYDHSAHRQTHTYKYLEPFQAFSGISACVATEGHREFDALDSANNVRWLQTFERGVRHTVGVLLPPKTASLGPFLTNKKKHDS